MKRSVTTMEVLLICPAAFFMTAVVVRHMPPLQAETAITSQRIVMWHAERQWTLWVFLIALPFAVLVTGCAMLLRNWQRGVALPYDPDPRQRLAAIATIWAQPTTLVVMGATLTAAGILVIVILHMLAN
jgi:hypothetical protein